MTSGQFASVPLDFIFVNRDERQRKELKNIEALAQSIARIGLINPPVIERTGELRTGERRWTAVKSLGWTSIPVQYVDELSPAEFQLLELEENIKREDLDWPDECAAVAKYHELKSADDPAWSLEKTANALGVGASYVGTHIAVYKELQAGNARVIEAPKFSVARGIVQRTNERAAASSVSSAIAAIPQFAPAQKAKPVVPLLNADFSLWAPAYSGEKFNLLHCDFPYGVNMQSADQGQAAALGGYEDGFETYTNLLDVLDASMDNVVADSAHLIFWFSMDYYEFTKDRLTMMNWKVNPFPLIWFKVDNTGILPDPQRGPRRNYETAFLASRGDRKLTAKGAVSNITAHPGRDKSIHMSEKPVPMLRHFMSMVCDEYSRVLDPTAGSGNSLKAATALGASSVLGLEISTEFYTRSVEAYFGDSND